MFSTNIRMEYVGDQQDFSLLGFIGCEVEVRYGRWFICGKLGVDEGDHYEVRQDENASVWFDDEDVCSLVRNSTTNPREPIIIYLKG